MDGSTVGGPYDGFSPGGILFSPDSRRFAYVIKRGDSWLAVVDGQEHSPFPTILQRSLTFSPDSSKLGYVAGVSGRWVGEAFVGEAAPVIDKATGRAWQHDGASKRHGLSEELCFSPDSRRFAYSGVRDGHSPDRPGREIQFRSEDVEVTPRSRSGHPEFDTVICPHRSES